MKTDILVPTFRGISDTVEMYESLKRTTRDYRLIIVDGNSDDGTPEFFETQEGVEVIRLPENRGFGVAINEGLKRIEAENVVLLNNDVVLTPDWLGRLLDIKNRIPVPVGMIGPVSNYAGGRQSVQITEADPNAQALKIAKEFEQNPVAEVSFLSFFCCLIDSNVIESLGPLEEWFPGGFEDNSYCIQAIDGGWRLFVAQNVFVHHKGSRTLKREFNDPGLVFSPRFEYFKKHYPKQPQKIVALYRVQNNHQMFKRSLEHTSKLVDGIFVWDDNSSPSLQKVVSSFPKVEWFYHSDLSFDEYRDRSMLLTQAKTSKYDWALVLDSDEWLESRITYESLHNLVRVPDPIIKSLVFFEDTFWFKNFFRVDGIWKGQFHDRLFKLSLNQELTRGTSKGFHCSTTPVLPIESRRVTSLRIEHYGYLDPKARQRKYDFYTKQDTDKRPELIGGADYAHLLDIGPIQINRFVPDNHLSLNVLMRPGEEREAAQLFNELWGIPQEINVLAEEENESVQHLRDLFGANVYIDTEEMDLSTKRNFLLDKTSERWAFYLDTDEKLEKPVMLRVMMDSYPDGYLFYVKNVQKTRQVTVSENVRMFQRESGFRFSGLVHETVEDSIKEDNRIVNAPIAIVHLGYLKDDKFLKDKIDSYAKTLFKELEERPDDARIHFSLGLHYINEGDREKALECLEKAVELNPRFIEAKKELAHFHLAKGKRLIGEVLPIMPNSHPLKQQLAGMKGELDKMIEDRIVIGKGNEDIDQNQGRRDQEDDRQAGERSGDGSEPDDAGGRLSVARNEKVN